MYQVKELGNGNAIVWKDYQYNEIYKSAEQMPITGLGQNVSAKTFTI